jgi:hypothetical protein
MDAPVGTKNLKPTTMPIALPRLTIPDAAVRPRDESQIGRFLPPGQRTASVPHAPKGSGDPANKPCRN